MKKMMMVLMVVVFMLMVGVMPTMAQEVDTSGAVVIDLGNGVMVDQLVVMGVIFFIVGLVALAGTEAAMLYRSFPPVVQSVIGLLGEMAKDQAERIVKATPTPIDDELLNMLVEKVLEKLKGTIRMELEEVLLKGERVTVAESVKAMDEAIFGANSRGEGIDIDDGVLGDPVPIGG